MLSSMDGASIEELGCSPAGETALAPPCPEPGLPWLAHTQPPKSGEWDIGVRTPEATGKHIWTDAGPNSLEPLRRWRFRPLPLRDKKDTEK